MSRCGKRRVGMIFQDDLLFPHLSVAANIRFGLKGQPRSVADQRVTEVAAACGVTHLLQRGPATLSGGERQRVGLGACAGPPSSASCSATSRSPRSISRAGTDSSSSSAQFNVPKGSRCFYRHAQPRGKPSPWGTRLFLLAKGRVLAEGEPLAVLADSWSGSAHGIEGVRNVFPAEVDAHVDDGTATRLLLKDGPALVVPRTERARGEPQRSSKSVVRTSCSPWARFRA